MKTHTTKDRLNFLIFICSIVSALSSCAPSFYYQLYDVRTQDAPTNQNQYVFDYSDISIKYDFWADEGKSDFIFTNNSDKDIYIDLEASHLILNGFANTYYQNIIITSTSNLGASTMYYPMYTYNVATLSTSSGNSITHMPAKVICIPSNSSKKIKGFNLRQIVYYDCDFELYPSKKQIKTQNFQIENSPLIFKNIISYSFNKSVDSLIRIENNFWVSSITNYPKSEIIQSRYPEYCGRKSTILETYWVKSSPTMFYLEYTP